MVDVLAIVGPTASGKTALSIRLAKQLGGEVINGDSMQVYKGLDIGTAKITAEEMEGVPHHLLDFKDPHESFSVADYQKMVRDKIEEIRSRGNLPIIVGGTGLYVQAVLFDFRFTEEPVDDKLREELYAELEANGPLHMYQKLLGLEPENDIHPNNTRRVIRALEVHLSGSKKGSVQQGAIPFYNEAIVGLDMPREILYERINERVDRMMEKGLFEEAKGLYSKGIKDCQSVQAIGYKEMYAVIENRMSMEEAVEKLKQNSRKYAKRQFTYFRNKLPVYWVDALKPVEKISEEIERFLQENEKNSRIRLIEHKKSAEDIEGDIS